MSDISSYFEFSLGKNPWAERIEEVAALANEKLGVQLERRLRSEVDLGLDSRLAVKAQSIRVKAEGDRLVVDTRGQDEVLGGEQKEDRPDTMEDLFRMSDGVPNVDEMGRIYYKKVTFSSLFQEQQEKLQKQNIEQISTSTAQLHMPQAIKEAIAEVDLIHLGDK